MAKLVVTEVLEGTNEQIRKWESELKTRATNSQSQYKDVYGNCFKGVTVETTYDAEDTPMQKHLRKQLKTLSRILSKKAIAQANEIIDSYADSDLTEEEVEELEEASDLLVYFF